MDKGPKKMQSATLVAPDIIPVLRQNQDSLLETTVSRIKEPLEASVSRTKELAETSVSRTKESAAKEIAEASISRTKELAESVGVRLTPNELTTLRQKLSDTSGQTIQEQMNDLAQDALKRKVGIVPVCYSSQTATILPKLTLFSGMETTLNRIGDPRNLPECYCFERKCFG